MEENFVQIFLVRISIFIILLFPCTVHASSVSFKWDANTESDLAGYYMYRSYNECISYSKIVTIGKIETAYTDKTLNNNIRSCYYITAFNTSGLESLKSNIIVILAGSAEDKSLKKRYFKLKSLKPKFGFGFGFD